MDNNCCLVKMLLDKLRLGRQVLAYLDDKLVHTKLESEHLHALDKVLEAHVDAGIKLKAKKTFLFEKAVDFLGHRVSAEGITLSSRLPGTWTTLRPSRPPPAARR